jgi:anti-sigma-K factor RskA
MTHDQFRELLPLYVVGVLDGDDLHEFERYTAEHSETCSREITEFRAVADQIALAATPIKPSTEVFKGVTAAIDDHSRMTKRLNASERRARKEFSVGMIVFRWIPWAATLILCVLVVIMNNHLREVTSQLALMTGRNTALQSENTTQQTKLTDLTGQLHQLNTVVATQTKEFKLQSDQFRDKNEQQRLDIEALQATNKRLTDDKAALTRVADELRRELENQRQQVASLDRKLTAQSSALDLMMDPTIRVFAMTDPSGATKAVAKAYWHERKKTGVIAASNLDPVLQGKGKCLELWTMCGNVPVAAGIGWTDAAGHAMLSIKPDNSFVCADKFAVSIEPETGSAAPSGPVVLLGH